MAVNYEQFCIKSVDGGDAADSSSKVPISKILEPSQLCDYSSKKIEERWKIPEVDGCKCNRRRCNIYQFQLFWKEHQALVKEHSKLMVDWCFTQKLSQQLEDLQDLKERHNQFRKRLSDAGIRRRYQKCGNVDYLSLLSSEGRCFTPYECRIKRLEKDGRLLWAKNF
ncbi:uncharacterized protein Bfra_004779 [Botrytis fragariae]|uniref:Uncharacterized protein n=1 Tax=Botrytis fragariae TaxID=1964551 RepID=A0A8H6AW98_9HELO|nr:uncharacterized protein Bfra_004779 [Botrytis fragariae]KAF5874761.1 hypothetical protein Bfra_004779 [Botrytis fragariae]